MQDIGSRLNQILPKIQEDNFLEQKGLGNEVGFFIFDYDPEDEMLVRSQIEILKNRLNSPTSDRRVVEFNLYEMLLDILKERGLLDKMQKFEQEHGSEYLLEGIRSAVSPEVYIEKIKNHPEDYEIVFLTGVGKVWPVLRSHTVLNNLHHVLDKTPVIMFFPGNYDGVELRLFGRIKDDNYYRAFSLVPR